MEFKDKKGIYQQIGDNLCEMILSKQIESGTKIPSVREQAATLGVNQNTIMRTYSELQREGVIENKRGIGYFVSTDAESIITKGRKKEFFDTALPEIIKQIKLLQLTKEELKDLLDAIK